VTAIAARRTRRTVVGAAVALMLIAAASVMFGVGVVTLSNSQEGEAVGVDARPRVQFPVTPNAMLAVTDETGRLASLVVMTLLPEGQGGSIVTIPVTADVTAGFGAERRSAASAFGTVDLAGFVTLVEEMLSITVQRAEAVDAPALAALLPDIGVSQLVLPTDVIDTQGGGGVIATSGPHTFTLDEMAELLAAIDDDVEVDASHPTDVAVWESLARSAPVAVPPEAVPVDDIGRPVAPADVAELVTRLWQGEVTVRDILVLPVAEAENPTEVDVVLIDRRDSALVFAQISPGVVSTPNLGLKVRIVANFTDDELAVAEDLYGSSSDVVFALIGRLLFLSANIVSVDTAASGIPPVTIIEVADERQLQATVDAVGSLLGEVEGRVADTVLEGVDVEITLGQSYLEHELGRATSGLSDAPEQTDAPAETGTSDAPDTSSGTEVPPTSAVADTVPGDG
jgi:hypothetical protein